MRVRAGLASVAACGMAFGMWVATGGVAGAAVAVLGIIQVAELPDIPLSVFHNGLFRYPIDQIVDDHGVRMGSLGSDLFHDPDDSYNEFWAVTDRGPNGNPGRRTFVAPKFDPVILHVRVQDTSIGSPRSMSISSTRRARSWRSRPTAAWCRVR